MGWDLTGTDKMEDLAPWSEEIPEYIKLGGNYAKEENNEADKLQTLESA